jgi:hypothetical protein
LLEKFLRDLRDACACSQQDMLPDCNRCDHERQTSCVRGVCLRFYIM